MRFLIRNFFIALLGLTAACADGGALPTSIREEPVGERWLVAHLNTPNADDGAVLLRLSGGPILAVEGVKSAVQVGVEGTAGAVVLVHGAVAAGPVVRIRIPEHVNPANYSGAVMQVAQRETFRQRSIDGYGIVLNAAS